MPNPLAILAPAVTQGNSMPEPSSSSSSTPSGAGQLVTATCAVLLAAAVLAGVPVALNGWSELSARRARLDLRASHLKEAARYVRDGNYRLATIGYRKARRADAIDPGVAIASDHLVVLSAVRSPGGLTGQVADEAEYIVERALRASSQPPHREYYLAARGAILAARGLVDAALAAFEEAVSVSADFAPAHYFRGKVLADVGRVEEAVPVLERAIQLDPANGFALKRLARIRKEANDLDEASALLQRVIDLGPDTDAQFQMGIVRDGQRKHEEALRHFVAVGQLKADYPNLGRNLGLTLFKLRRYAEAAKVLKQVFERTREIDIYYYIGRAVMELGDRQQAANIFQTIVSNRPQHAEARLDLARLLDQADQRDGARGHYAAFLKAAEGRADLAEEVRWVRQRLEQLRAASGGTGR